jgi:sigma-B regulation protein RsbQ
MDVTHGPLPMSAIRKRHNVNVTGKGTVPMLFAHGFGCDQNMWRHVAPAFEDAYKVILFDYLGHGQSDRSAYDRTRYETLDGYVDDVLAICRDLDVRHGVFVGHSVSAMIGVLASIREPERFDQLVLIGPSPRYINEDGYTGGFTRSDIDGLLDSLDSNFLGWSSAMAPVIMGTPDRPELGTALANTFCQTDPEVAKQFARATFLSDNRTDLARVRARALVLQCSQDVIAPEAVGRYVAQHIPNATFVQMDATGHCPNLSAPGETIAAMRAFLG